MANKVDWDKFFWDTRERYKRFIKSSFRTALNNSSDQETVINKYVMKFHLDLLDSDPLIDDLFDDFKTYRKMGFKYPIKATLIDLEERRKRILDILKEQNKKAKELNNGFEAFIENLPENFKLKHDTLEDEYIHSAGLEDVDFSLKDNEIKIIKYHKIKDIVKILVKRDVLIKLAIDFGVKYGIRSIKMAQKNLEKLDNYLYHPRDADINSLPDINIDNNEKKPQSLGFLLSGPQPGQI